MLFTSAVHFCFDFGVGLIAVLAGHLGMLLGNDLLGRRHEGVTVHDDDSGLRHRGPSRGVRLGGGGFLQSMQEVRRSLCVGRGAREDWRTDAGK